MALPLGYQVDRLGQFVEPGSTKHVLEHSFLFGGSLPSGWGTSNSTTSIASPAADAAGVAMNESNDGYFRVGTSSAATAIGDVALLYGPAISMSRVKGIHFEVSGLYWNDSWVDSLAASVRIALRNVETASAGIDASQFSTDATTQWRVPGVGGSDPSDAYYEMRTSGEANKRRSVGLLLLPGTKEAFLTEGGVDNVIAYRRATNVAVGMVRPVLQITAQEAVRKAFRLSGLRLTVWQH